MKICLKSDKKDSFFPLHVCNYVLFAYFVLYFLGRSSVERPAFAYKSSGHKRRSSQVSHKYCDIDQWLCKRKLKSCNFKFNSKYVLRSCGLVHGSYWWFDWQFHLLFIHSFVSNSFLLSGSDVITTATYQASVRGFINHLDVSPEGARELLGSGVRLAKDTAEQFVRHHHPAGTNAETSYIVGALAYMRCDACWIVEFKP